MTLDEKREHNRRLDKYIQETEELVNKACRKFNKTKKLSQDLGV